ncbi:glycoside hydrolase family 92 protein [Maribellus comscasis]|uniref:Glycoside hydrolase family 92 protein n=1 Tax=Maribellus comscasis TaxID=2681766 RepID=A0A6I6KB74_9BACT|nr:GH92 family glycosyl hydrolase [Maribellus comscasis]QGY47464.1 glycoside hydrolase family 92 protein [Maribellus comscasis]
MNVKSGQFVIVLMIFFSVFSCTKQTGEHFDPVKYVDPNIGGVGHILQPTRPTVQLPNQPIRMYPNREDYLDDQITSFPLSMISHRNGQLFRLMPFTGETANPVSEWGKQNETATPYYYSVWLMDYNTTLEFVPGAKAGFFRIKFPDSEIAKINYTIANNGTFKVEGENTISGVESFKGMNAFVYGEFDATINSSEILEDGKQLVLAFSENSQALNFKYAISYISLEQAKKNLQNEIAAWDFDKLKENARLAWAESLSQIEVEGGTEAQKRTFYTAFYRTYERMVNITEDGKYYSNYDGKVHEDEQPFYIDDWIWDTYLAHHPLRALLDPDIENDMMSSYLRMYEQSGWLPQFCLLWGENPCMNGFHSTVSFLDGFRKNVLDFDLEKAYEGMKKNALEGTMLPWRNGAACSLDTFYQEHGYYPALHPGEEETEPMVHSFEKRQAVAVTLGHSYDDWALAQLAKEFGKDDDYKLFSEKANNYKNLYWEEKGFFMPKDASGKWIDIDPKWAGGMGGRDYYDENNGWTYLWQVQHDVDGLMNLMGGKEIFEARLDQLFREDLGRSKYANWAKFPDFTGIVGQFSMGNEPSFHIPYLYNFTDSPWKTQKKIRMLLDAWYPDNIFGIPGDEDGGGMTAFVVFSFMGFYPVVPGLPIYTIGSPVFEKVTIHLDNGNDFKVVTENYAENHIYIQKAWLNGKPLDGPWITHNEVVNGGELKLEMGQKPNMEWGSVELFNQLTSSYLK